MKYSVIDNIYAGGADITISHVAKCCKDYFEGQYMLITTLDSCHSPAELKLWLEYLKQNKYKYDILGQYVLISKEHVWNIVNDGRTFFHFDEVYLYDHIPIHLPPINISFTSDGYLFSEKVPDVFIEQYRNSRASRYLSDGCELNFACRSETLIRCIAEIENKLI